MIGQTRKFSFTLAAGAVLPFAGYPFIRIQAITAGYKLRIRTAEGDDFELGQSQRYTWPREYTPKNITFQNDNGVSITVELLLGAGVLDDPELAGTVTVSEVTAPVTVLADQPGVLVDPAGVGAALNASGYFGGSIWRSASGSTYASGQLWNPAGSGVYAIITHLRARADVAGNIYFQSSALALTNLGMQGANLYDGEAAGALQLRQAAPTSIAEYATNLFNLPVPANEWIDIIQPPALARLDEGAGFAVTIGTVTQDIWLDARWKEYAV